MKELPFTKEDRVAMVDGARKAAVGPEREGFFTRIAEYFDERRTEATDLVSQRPLRAPETNDKTL